MSTDFEIGHFLRARIIPKAALYYTGDIVEDDDDDDYDEGKLVMLGTDAVCEGFDGAKYRNNFLVQ